MNDPDFFDQFVVFIKLRNGSYEIAKYKASAFDKLKPGAKLVHVYRGHHYILDRATAFHLKGWNPWFRQCFLSCYADILPAPRRGLLLFKEPASQFKGIEFGILPLDRLEDIMAEPDEDGKVLERGPTAIMNPNLYKTLQENPLMYNAVRSAPFGMMANWKLTTFVLLGLVGLIILLYMGGYFG